jgi:hypothetical protein
MTDFEENEGGLPDDGAAAFSVNGWPGVGAGNFLTGSGLLGITQAPASADARAGPAPVDAIISDPAPTMVPGTSMASAGWLGTILDAAKGRSEPVQTANTTINGVPLAIRQPQPDETGDPRVGDVAGLKRSLARLSPSAWPPSATGIWPGYPCLTRPTKPSLRIISRTCLSKDGPRARPGETPGAAISQVSRG